MKPFAIGALRWLMGLITGLVAAGVLFGLAAVATGSGSAGGAFGLLALGFGLAFFPALFASRTRSPRQVIRRALVVVGLESLLAVVLAAFKLASVPLLDPGWFRWVTAILETGVSIANASSGVVLVAGILALALSVILLLGLRHSPPARVAGQPATAAQRLSPSKPGDGVRPAAPPAAAKAPAARDDDDIKALLAGVQDKVARAQKTAPPEK